MDVCVCVGPNVCGSVYQGDAEPFFCHSELETVLTNRLHAPEFAQALICLCNDPLLDYASVSKALLAVKVLIARSLRTRLFLGCPPAGAGAGGGNGDGGWPGRQGVDVSADGGSEVLYFVDVKHGRILLSDSLPDCMDASDVLASAVNQLLGSRLAAHLLALSVALRAEPASMHQVLARLGVCVEEAVEEMAMASRGVPGTVLLAPDSALLSVQPLRRFVTGEVVAWADESGSEEVLRYGVVVVEGERTGGAGSGLDSGVGAGGGAGDRPALRRLQIRVSEFEVRSFLSSDVLCFLPTTSFHPDHSRPPMPGASGLTAKTLPEGAGEGGRGGDTNGASVSGGGRADGVEEVAGRQENGGRHEAVKAVEVAGAVERLLRRLDVPLSLGQSELLESVLDLKVYCPAKSRPQTLFIVQGVGPLYFVSREV
jgi:hypothetical protein